MNNRETVEKLYLLIDELKMRCNKHSIGVCSNYRCVKDGGHEKGTPVNYSNSTCETDSYINAINNAISCIVEKIEIEDENYVPKAGPYEARSGREYIKFTTNDLPEAQKLAIQYFGKGVKIILSEKPNKGIPYDVCVFENEMWQSLK